MKLSVTKCFYDISNNNAYRKVGDVVEYPEERAKEIENRGFGRIIEEKPTNVSPKVEKESETKKKDSLETKKERKKK